MNIDSMSRKIKKYQDALEAVQDECLKILNAPIPPEEVLNGVRLIESIVKLELDRRDDA